MRATALAALAAIAVAARADAAEVVSATEVRPRLEELTVRTGALAADTHVRVLLPVEYELRPKRHWPVVYLLHAAMGDHTSWSKALDTIDSASDLPAIVVMPDGGHSGFYSDWWNGGAGGPPAWETYHVGELLPLIDGRYRTRGVARRADPDGSVDGRVRRVQLRRPASRSVRRRDQHLRGARHQLRRRPVDRHQSARCSTSSPPTRLRPARDPGDPVAGPQPVGPRRRTCAGSNSRSVLTTAGRGRATSASTGSSTRSTR